jgi:uncharacterized protein
MDPPAIAGLDLKMSAELPQRLRGLLSPAAYPHPVDSIELVQTHISWVLLTGRFAYKLKRPVRYAFIDLSSPERREFLCLEELRLNQRFAPQLYLEVCPITAPAGMARIGGDGKAIEYAVKMRQFPREQELDRLLEAGTIAPQELENFGGELATIHAQLPTAGIGSAWGTPERVRELVLMNLTQCAQAAAAFNAVARVEALRAPLEAQLRALSDCMAARCAAGRVRECHGDLHTRNVVRRGNHLLAFDCIEYEAAFRWIDVADEIAFLLSDLNSRGCRDQARAFLAGYLAASGDYEACRLLPLYQAHRGLVRAKVVALHATSGSEVEIATLTSEWRRLISFAAAVLMPRQPRMFLTCGPSGAGKTWLSGRLAPRLGAIHLRSDVERKRAAGLAPTERAGADPGSGLYGSRISAATYMRLLQAAEDVLAGGWDVIVDATFSRRDEREHFAARARRLGIGWTLIVCEAPIDVMRSRVAARERAAEDPSDADQAVLEWQLARQDALDETERAHAIRVDTQDPGGVEETIRQITRG